MPKKKFVARPKNTGSITQVGDERWKLAVYMGRDENGKQRRRYKTVPGPKWFAERELARLQLAYSGTVADQVDITVGAVLQAWSEERLSELTPKGRSNTRNIVKRLRPLDHLVVSNCRPSDFETLYRSFADQGLSRSYIRRIHGTVRAALNWALAEGLVASNPAALCREVGHESPAVKRDKIPTRRAIKDIVNNCDDPWFADVVRFAVLTGARRGEIVALRWDDIEDEGEFSTVTFRRRMSDSEVIDGLKAGDEKRVKISTDVIEAIRSNARDAETWVFGDDEAKPVHPNTVSRKFRLAREQAGVQDCRFHDLRHFCASTLLASGMDAVAVAKHLGHASPTTTLKIYAHVLDPESTAAAATMSEAFLP